MMKKFKFKDILSNQVGFTLAEIMLAAGIMGGLLMGTISFFQLVNKSNTKVLNDVTDSMENLYLEQALASDISASRYSFNNLNFKDDNGRVFFDYLFDSACMKNCSRTFSLEKSNQVDTYSESLYFIIEERFNRKEISFDPIVAYSDANATNFVSINRDPGTEKRLSERTFSPWVNNRLLFMFSPSPTRPSGSDARETAPTIISYLGWVKEGEVKLEKETIGGVFSNSESILDENDMLKSMPYFAGLPSDVIMTNVRVIRYRMLTHEKRKGVLTGKLYRATKRVGGEFVEVLLATDVKSLIFKRPNISSAEIRYELNRDDL
jgi:Tfp pilus assembly protein PilE